MKKIPAFLACTLLAFTDIAQAQEIPTVFGNLSLQEQQTTITGTLTHYNPAVDSLKYCQFTHYTLFDSRSNVRIIDIQPSGRFSINLALDRPKEINMLFGTYKCSIYAVPGSALDITLDLDSFKLLAGLPNLDRLKYSAPLQFSGKYARLNQEINHFLPIYYNIYDILNNANQKRSLPIAQFKTSRLAIMQRTLDSLTGFHKRYNTSSEFRNYMELVIRYKTAQDLLEPLQPKPTIDQPDLAAERLEIIKQFPINNAQAFITDQYLSYVLQFQRQVISKGRSSNPKEDAPYLVQYIKNSGINIPEEEQNIFLNANTISSEHQQLRTKYSTVITEYRNKRSMPIRMEAIDANIPPGIGRDLAISMLLTFYINTQKMVFSEEELTIAVNKIANTTIQKMVRQEYQQVIDAKNKNQFANNSLMDDPAVAKGKALFQQIIQPYRGKVIYIDFWAPWCGPCMQEVPHAKKLQQSLEGKDIIFLNIGVRCKKEEWETTIKNKQLEGKHYFANDDEGILLSAFLNFTGIPRYLLVDKQGNIVDNKAPLPSQEPISLITKYLQ